MINKGEIIMTITDNHLIKLEGAYNVRELGGYITADGHKTKKGVFIRSDGTGNLSDKDVAILKKLGLSMVIDLRSFDEVDQYPSKLRNCENIRYENILMFDGVMSAVIKGSVPTFMGRMYVSLLNRCKDKYAQIFKMFAENNGLTLFNCTAGKDRTGVVAMLLLQLAGVDDGIIVADYSVSEHNIKFATQKQKEMLKKRGIKIPNYIFKSNPKNMMYTLNWLKKYYKNSENYLLNCGLSQTEINIIKKRFVE